jgi:hypothetical protein
MSRTSLARRRSSRALSALVAATTLAIPAVALAVDLTSSAGLLFDIQERSSGELSNGSIDAYDGCYYLDVGGTRYTSGGATTSADGRTVTLNEATVSGLRVQRIVYVPSSGGSWARYLDVVTNPGATEVSTTVRISGNLGSDSSTRLIATSSGDTVLTTADAWFSTDDTDGSGDPSLAHLFQGGPASGAAVSARTMTLSTDNIDVQFDVMVPAGGRVAILSFALQYNSQSEVQAEATRLLELPDDAILGLDEYAGDIVNFSLGSFTEPCVGVPELGACTTPRGESGICRMGSCCAGCWNGTRCVSGRSAAACGRRGAACATCADTDACTSDVCSDTGTCTYPPAPRGTVCDDSLFCTATDRCDGAGRCMGGGDRCDDGVACTTDVCAEATDSCVSTPPSDQCIIGRDCVAAGTRPMGFDCLVCDPARNPRGWSGVAGVCAIGGECVMPGTRHPAYPCLVCDPDRNTSDWSVLGEGETCIEAACAGGRLTTAGTCSSTGVCIAGAAVRCVAGYCEDGMTCATTCTEGECPGTTFCAPSGVCERRRANGSSCAADGDCESGACVDAICCDTGCTETCRSCIVPGSVGRCTDVPAMTDPDGECAPGACDGMGACIAGDAGPMSPDAGVLLPDAGPPVDAARFIDTGAGGIDAAVTPMPPSSSGGCAVATRSRHGSLAALLGLAIALLGLARARRR